MKKLYQIVVLIFAVLIIANSFNCSSIAIVTVILENEYSILVSSFVLVTSVSNPENITNIDNSIDYITISITNMYGNQLSLFFLFNVDDLALMKNSLTIVFFDNSFIQYVFSIE